LGSWVARTGTGQVVVVVDVTEAEAAAIEEGAGAEKMTARSR